MAKTNRLSQSVRNNDELLARWREIKGRWGFSGPQLWVMLIDGHTGIQLIQIEALPRSPQPGDVERLMQSLREMGEGLSVAFMYARPGHWPRQLDDLAWVNDLVRGVQVAGLPSWPVHVACDDGVQMVAADDLSDAS